jgi:hypothetical protein
MAEKSGPHGQLPEDAWLEVLSGARPAAPGSDEELAATGGELIRARFEAALRTVRAAPDPELTRVRVLAVARAGPRAQQRRSRAMVLSAAAGLAAGVVAMLLLRPVLVPRDFAEVRGSRELVSLAHRPDAGARAIRHFLVRSSNVPATAAQLAAILARARAPYRVGPQPGGGLQLEVEPLHAVPASVSRAAAALDIDFPPDTAVQVDVEVP